MSAINFTKFLQFNIDLAKKVHNLGADTLKVMLVNSPPPVDTNGIKGDLTEISAGNGYSAGGNTVTAVLGDTKSTVGLFLTDTDFTASGGAIGAFRYAVLYNDTPTSPADPLIAWWDLGRSITLNDGETLHLNFQEAAFNIVHVASNVPSGNPTTGFTITIPSRVATNDILLLAITNRGATADPSTPTDDDSGGNTWTKLTSTNNGSFNGSVWWKRATSGTASKTITVAGCTGSSAGGLSVYRGVSRKSTPYENASGESNASGNTTHSAILPTLNDSMICLFNFNTDDALLVTGEKCAINPKELTKRFEKVSTGGDDCACSHASGAQVGTQSDTGAISWVQSNSASISIVFNLLVFQDYTVEVVPITNE